MDQCLLNFFYKTCKRKQKDNIKGTNTLFFIHTNQLPNNKKPTYLCICEHFRPQKEDPYHVRFNVVKNLINYQVENYTTTADLTTSKLLISIVIYKNGATFICIDLSNFYLITSFNNKSDYESARIPELVIS